MSLEESISTLSTHDQMKEAVKEKALGILKMDEKVKRLSNDIDKGDTNLFFLEMFGKKVMFTSKLITSLQTAFGMSFYEQISKKLGELVGYEVQNQYKITGCLHAEARSYLDALLENLKYTPNRETEYQCLSDIYEQNKDNMGPLVEIHDSTVDVFIKKPDGTEIFIDITTVKPNKKEFRTMKEKILKWYFLRLSHGDISPDKIKTYIAIPYNPESRTDNTYTRWNNYYDDKDLLVGDQLWKLVSDGQFSLDDMIEVFKEIGIESKENIEKSMNTDHF
jgi:hypothetical protein